MNATASTKICRSFGLISLRIETNFMVGPVTLVLYEVRTDKNEVRFRQAITERAAPYTIFGLRTSNSGQRVTLRGEVHNVGSYQLKATSDDNPTHTKTASFTVSSWGTRHTVIQCKMDTLGNQIGSTIGFLLGQYCCMLP
jgi:hypothetical protein